MSRLGRSSLHTCQVAYHTKAYQTGAYLTGAYQTGAYLGFYGMKQLHVGVFPLPREWDVSPSQGYLQR